MSDTFVGYICWIYLLDIFVGYICWIYLWNIIFYIFVGYICWIYLGGILHHWRNVGYICRSILPTGLRAKDVTLWPKKTRKILQMSIYGEKDVNQSYVRQQRPWHRFSAEQKEEVFRPATSSLLSSSSSSKEFATAEKSSQHCIGKWGKTETFSLEQKCGNSVKAFWHGVQVNITLTYFNFALTILFSSSPIVTGRDRTASVGSTS